MTGDRYMSREGGPLDARPEPPRYPDCRFYMRCLNKYSKKIARNGGRMKCQGCKRYVKTEIREVDFHGYYKLLRAIFIHEKIFQPFEQRNATKIPENL